MVYLSSYLHDVLGVKVVVVAGKKMKKKPPQTKTVPVLDDQENDQNVAAATESKSPGID